MSELAWLAIYCLAVLVFSMAGGYLPFVGKVGHTRLQFYLSASAGVMLGAAFFHVMPDAFERLRPFWFGLWMSVGVVGMFFIERFIAPHTHEIDSGHHHHLSHEDHPNHPGRHEHSHSAEDDYAQTAGQLHDYRAVAPAMAGWMAVLGLILHTFMNGVGLAGAVKAESGASLPGWALFLAIFLHKPADALAISTVLSRKGVERAKIILVQLGFAAMVPLGATIFELAQDKVETAMQSYVTGAALAFSAGTFLFIALSDLLPEVQFHRHDRIPLFGCLVLGLAIMGGIAALEHTHETGDEKEKTERKANGRQDQDRSGQKKDSDGHGD